MYVCTYTHMYSPEDLCVHTQMNGGSGRVSALGGRTGGKLAWRRCGQICIWHIYRYVHLHMYTCMYVFHMYTYTHTHTHTHMQKPSLEEMWTAKRAEILRRLGLPERSGGAGGARRGGGASGGGGDLVVVNRGKTPPAASLLRDSYETGTRPLRAGVSEVPAL